MFMKIAILGTGNVGRRLGKLLSSAKHEVVFGSRQMNETQLPIQEAVLKSYKEAVAFAEVVFIATPWANDITTNLLKDIGDFRGKIIVDCTNPLAPDYMSNLIGHTSSSAEEIQRIVGATRGIVKAFNTIFADIMEAGKQQFDGGRATGFYCGDDDESKAIVHQLITDCGFEPVHAGALKNARYLEPMAQLNIQIAYGLSGGTDVAFRYMDRGGATK
jgi:8-hydroxy-5-deazaflavin:NADPH oxidoreductase